MAAPRLPSRIVDIASMNPGDRPHPARALPSEGRDTGGMRTARGDREDGAVYSFSYRSAGLPHVWGEITWAGGRRAQKHLVFQALRLAVPPAGPKSVVTIQS
jgi:hypothetical protein